MSDIYPLVLGQNAPTIFSPDELVSFIREKLGDDVAAAVRSGMMAVDEEDLDKIRQQIGYVHDELDSLERVIDKISDRIGGLPL